MTIINTHFKASTIEYTMNLFQAFFDKIPIPIVLVNKEAIIIYFNKSYANFLHIEYKTDNIMGKHVRDIIPNSRLPIVIETKVPEIDSTHVYPDGRTAIGSRIPIMEGDEVIGAFAYIIFEDAQELQKLAGKYRKLEEEIHKYKEILSNRSFAKYTFLDIVGQSEMIMECKKTAGKYANIDLPVLILGESGVGKEIFVHSIHDSSRRKYGPLIRVNCGAIPTELFEAEFFGYEAGAFTGARKEGKKGFFELAHKGTLFLDEIAELPLYMQIKLLRVIQEKEFLKVGGEKYQQCDVRIIAATNRDIYQMVRNGEFRQDLIYRLNTLVLVVPPLRERNNDIISLSEHFLNQFYEQHSLPKKTLAPEALKVLLNYSWPGNIRELKNIIERAAVMSLGERIESKEIELLIYNHSLIKTNTMLPLKEYVGLKEKEYIIKALRECGGNKTKAAQLLGIHRSFLYKKYPDLLT